jgi:ABC-type glycerol-3-phosphate transport system substrate-binding protein
VRRLITSLLVTLVLAGCGQRATVAADASSTTARDTTSIPSEPSITPTSTRPASE